MAALYEVTATALNLRAAPATTATVLTVLRRGQVCVGAGDAVAAWLPVVYDRFSGFVGAGFVRATDAPVPGPIPSPVGPGLAAPMPLSPARPAVDPETKLRDRAMLHPKFRDALERLLAQTDADGLQFRVFEAFRTPERQEWLYAQGRTRAGSIVTKARAWQSFHQFGLAADLVLFVDGQWSWSDAGDLKARWTRLRQIADQAGLRTLSWEVPHVEWPVSVDDVVAPPMLADGDEDWLENLQLASARWTNAGGAGGPMLASAERPPLPTGT